MLQIRVTGDKQLQEKLRHKIVKSDKLLNAMHKAALFVAGDAKKRAPVDTGHLRRSITAKAERVGDSVIGRVGTNVHYARFIELGRKRVITPVNAQALRFTVKEFVGTKGKSRLQRNVVFAKKAEAGKPGQKTANWERVEGDRIAKPFLLPALRENVKRIVETIKRAIDEVLSE